MVNSRTPGIKSNVAVGEKMANLNISSEAQKSRLLCGDILILTPKVSVYTHQVLTSDAGQNLSVKYKEAYENKHKNTCKTCQAKCWTPENLVTIACSSDEKIANLVTIAEH